LGRRPPVRVFGADFPTKDGSAIRDYIHVIDLAEAHAQGLNYLLMGGQSRALNLGTGKGSSVLDVINQVGKILGEDVPYEMHDRRPGDPAELVADPKLAMEILGWKAKFDIKNILSDALEWHKRLQ
jgi:UDP-glucose 4-epimerase